MKMFNPFEENLNFCAPIGIFLSSAGVDTFRARGDTQFHLARTLSIVFLQTVVIQRKTQSPSFFVEFLK
jgi:hypothetical protein